MSDDVARATAWIQASRPTLVCTHQRPDGDALGCLFALTLALRNQGGTDAAFLSEPVPERYACLFPEIGLLPGDRPVEWGRFAGVVCLDTANRERIDLPAEGRPADLEARLLNIDHHAGNENFGALCWLDPTAAATAQMLIPLLEPVMTPQIATCLLTGLVMDTGGFRFRNTTAAVLRDAARLCEWGAAYNHVVDGMFFRQSYARRRLEGYLVENASWLDDGRIVYAVLEPETMERLQVSPDDTEGLVDVLRSMDGVEVACLFQKEPDQVRLSLRSSSPEWPVVEIAEQLGGGGHVMAAGARIPGAGVPQAVAAFRELTQKVFGR